MFNLPCHHKDWLKKRRGELNQILKKGIIKLYENEVMNVKKRMAKEKDKIEAKDRNCLRADERMKRKLELKKTIS